MPFDRMVVFIPDWLSDETKKAVRATGAQLAYKR